MFTLPMFYSTLITVKVCVVDEKKKTLKGKKVLIGSICQLRKGSDNYKFNMKHLIASTGPYIITGASD